MKKKILYIAVSSQTGGVPKHILYALQYAKENGYHIAVAVPDDGDYYPWFQEYAEDVISLPLKPYSFRSLYQLSCYIKKNHISLVHSHGKGAGMYARPLKIMCPGVSVVHTFHGIYLEQYNRLFRIFYESIEKTLKYFSNAEISVSKSEEEEAKKLRFVLPERSYVIPNGVDPALFQTDEKEARTYLCKEFGLKQNSYLIVCVARLEKMKGHIYLLEAFEQFQKCYPDSSLLLVGDGPDRSAIENKLAELHLEKSVVLTGFRYDIPEILTGAELFVSASLKEGMPFTLLEALAAGKTVVATRVIGNQDIIQDGYNGLLVKSEDAEALCRGLLYAREHRETCACWGINGKKTIEESFTIHRSMERLFSIYDKLLEEK